MHFLDKLFFVCGFQHIDKVVDVPPVTQSRSVRVCVSLRVLLKEFPTFTT